MGADGWEFEMPTSKPGALEEDGDLKYEWSGQSLMKYFINDK